MVNGVFSVCWLTSDSSEASTISMQPRKLEILAKNIPWYRVGEDVISKNSVVKEFHFHFHLMNRAAFGCYLYGVDV